MPRRRCGGQMPSFAGISWATGRAGRDRPLPGTNSRAFGRCRASLLRPAARRPHFGRIDPGALGRLACLRHIDNFALCGDSHLVFLAADATGLGHAPGLTELRAFGGRRLLDDEALVVVLPAVLAGMTTRDTLGAVQGDGAGRFSQFQRLPGGRYLVPGGLPLAVPEPSVVPEPSPGPSRPGGGGQGEPALGMPLACAAPGLPRPGAPAERVPGGVVSSERRLPSAARTPVASAGRNIVVAGPCATAGSASKYRSASKYVAACSVSVPGIALAMRAIVSASACAIARRASAIPCARSTADSRTPSASRIAARFPASAFVTAARRSRSARICNSIDC